MLRLSNKLLLFALITICIIFLTSCFDSDEIDSIIFVIAIGVDKGISDKWLLTLQFPNLSESQGGGDPGSQGAGEYTFVSVDAPSFFTGINMLNASLPRKLNFMQTQIIMFSDELAQDGLVGEYIAPLTRYRQIRRSAHVFVVNGKAYDFIKDVKPLIGNTLSKNYQIWLDLSHHTGYFPHVTLEDFHQDINSPYLDCIATIVAVNKLKDYEDSTTGKDQVFNTGGKYIAGELPRMGENNRELWGTALFDKDKLVAKLNGDETRLLLMLRGDYKRGFYTIQDPKEPNLIIPLDVTMNSEPKIKINTSKSSPVINIEVKLNGDIMAVQSRYEYEQPELKSLLEAEFEEIIKEDMENLVKKCQKLNVDAFRFGEYATRNFLTINEFENYKWKEKYKTAEVNVNVKFIIRRTGTLIRSTPIS